MIKEEKSLLERKIEELELKNVEELLSLEQLIVLFEDIKNIENSNLNFLQKTLDEVVFNKDLIIGNLGYVCKKYFESYYEIKKKQIQNLKEIILLMKLKSLTKSGQENDEFVIVYNNDYLANNMNKPANEKYIFKNDIVEIIESISLINKFNNEINENFENNLNQKLNELKEMENLKELDILKEVKGEKSDFEEKLKDIIKFGVQSKNYEEVKNILLNDNSDNQHKACWLTNYFNKFRSQLSSVSLSVFKAMKELIEITLNKFYEKKLFQEIDLTIVLIQTFSTKKDNINNYLLEEEFKGKEIFQKEDFWKNTIQKKLDELLERINTERKDIGSKDYINFVKENIEPILISFAFSMKDFNLPNETKKKIIEEICNSDKLSQYGFDINRLMIYD